MSSEAIFISVHLVALCWFELLLFVSRAVFILIPFIPNKIFINFIDVGEQLHEIAKHKVRHTRDILIFKCFAWFVYY